MLARRVAVSISLFVVGVVLLLLVGFLSGVLCTDTLNITGEIHSHYCYLRFLFIYLFFLFYDLVVDRFVLLLYFCLFLAFLSATQWVFFFVFVFFNGHYKPIFHLTFFYLYSSIEHDKQIDSSLYYILFIFLIFVCEFCCRYRELQWFPGSEVAEFWGE